MAKNPVVSLLTLDAIMCEKEVELFVFLFFSFVCTFITQRGFRLLAATLKRNPITIMSETMVHCKNDYLTIFFNVNSSVI